jgi:hypothetical protein
MDGKHTGTGGQTQSISQAALLQQRDDASMGVFGYSHIYRELVEARRGQATKPLVEYGVPGLNGARRKSGESRHGRIT